MFSLKSIELTNSCPEKADCKVEILKNKAIDLKKEEATGKLHPEFVEDSTKTVIKISMDINADGAMVDAQYREEVLFEWNHNNDKINLENEDLNKASVTFGRFCFCDKDQVGYFKISEGNLEMNQGKLQLNFKTPSNLPQQMKELEAIYQLD